MTEPRVKTDWHPDIPTEYRNQIVTGDARELAKRIPDESIDLIFTDPPYLGKFLPLYEWLGVCAHRILKSGGYLFAYGSGYILPDILNAIKSSGLDFFWTFVLVHNGGYPRVWSRKLMSAYKPVIAFTKGKPNRLVWQSSMSTDRQDKRYHEWGQGSGFAIKELEMLTVPSDIIYDPFAGGGTVSAACKTLGRNYIASEIDPDTARLARERVQRTQPPLAGFNEAMQQAALFAPDNGKVVDNDG